MAHLIDKDAVVAEIEKRRKEIPKDETDKALRAVYGNEAFVLTDLLSFIDTLEVKEVNYRPMDKDFERDAVNFCLDNALNTTPRIAKTIAKHFFELGLKAQKGEEV